MSINKYTRVLSITTLIVALLGSLWSAAQADVVAGTSRTVTRDLIIRGVAEASANITLRDNILAGSYSYSNKQILGDWTATVTGGTVAIRLSPTVVDPYGSAQPTAGYLKKVGTPTQRFSVVLSVVNCDGSTINNWHVCSEGKQSIYGQLLTFETQNIVGGSYPVAIDVVAWLY